MCRASRAQACSVCTPLLEAIEWPSVRTMRASTRASQHARRCASPRAVCAGVARAFTSLLHGRVSCHVVMSVILFPVVLFPQVNACGQLERYRRSLCTNRCLFSDMRHASRFTIDVVRDDELHVFGTRLSCTLPSLPLIVCVCQTYIHGYVYTARS